MRVSGLDSGGLAALIVTQVGFGGSMGFLLGYGMKKLTTFFLKIVALTSSLFMLGIAWLASIGVVTLNLDAFTSTLEIGLGDAIANLVTLFAFLAQILPITGSFALGFYAGARKG